MRISLKDISRVLSNINTLISNEKGIKYVLLKVDGDKLNICYNDGRKAIIEKLDIVREDKDIEADIAVPFDRISHIIDACQPTGRIVTDEIILEFKEDNIINIQAEKKIPEYESEDSEPELRVYSVFNQSIKWVEASSSMRTSILTRMDYSKIFNPEDGVDEWDINELSNILESLSVEKNKRVYISPKKSMAFVSNMSYFSTISLDGEYSIPVVLNSNIAKAVSSILNKVDSDDSIIYVHTIDNRYMCLYNSEGTFGLFIEMQAVSNMDLSVLSKYQEKEYKDYQLTFVRDILSNVVDSVVKTNSTDKVAFKFNRDGNNIILNIESSNTNASIKNDYSMVCTDYIGLKDDIENLEIPINLKVLSDILSKCSSDYIALDIDTENMKCIRVGSIDMKKRLEYLNDMDIDIDINNSLDIRDKYLKYKFYTISSK